MVKDQLLKLKTEMATDPLGIGYAEMTDQQICDSLNAKTTISYRRVPMSEIHNWASSKRMVKRFADANMVDSALYKELEMLLSGKQEDASLVDPVGAQGLIGDLIAAEIMTVQEAAELGALGVVMISRADQIGLPKVRLGHVGQAKAVE